MGYAIDGGNYRTYIGKGDCFLDRSWSLNGDRFAKSLWGGGWYAIRQANLGLEALQNGLLKDATQEERDFLEGQLYFFRAWFYFQLTTYWGGLPYLERPLSPVEPLNMPRESYQENAEKMAKDFQRAADLLPVDWDVYKRQGMILLPVTVRRAIMLSVPTKSGHSLIWVSACFMPVVL